MWLLKRPKTRVKPVQVSDDVGPEVSSERHSCMLYPMYVVSMADFLTMRVAKPHQVLRAEGVAFEYPWKGEAASTFVSHQWVGRYHPDPSFAQLHVLQGIIRKAAVRGLKVDMDLFSAVLYKLKPTVKKHHVREMAVGCMWYDYFSVPQPEATRSSQHLDLTESMGRAVASLSAYVSRCRFFLVLAPFVAHEAGGLTDYLSWKTRGWCRFERMARVLSQGDTSMLVVSHSDTIYQVGAQDYLLDPVGWGAFSHEEDRDSLAPKVERMLIRRLEYLFHAGQEREYKDIMAHRGILLDGLPPQVSGTDSMCFRRSVASQRFSTVASPRDESNGAQSLFWATILGDVGAMRSLLASRVEVGCTEPRHNPNFLGIRGMTPAHYAVMHGQAEALQLLLERQADPNTTDTLFNSMLFFVPDRSARDVVRLLAEHRADCGWRNMYGHSALEVAVIRNRREGVSALLAIGHPVQANLDGLNALHQCVVFGASGDAARVLAEAGVSLQERFRPRVGGPLWVMVSIWTVSYRLGNRGHRCAFGYHCLDGTPLMFAVAGSQREIAVVLLERRADPDARNRRGLNSYDLARIFDMQFQLSGRS